METKTSEIDRLWIAIEQRSADHARLAERVNQLEALVAEFRARFGEQTVFENRPLEPLDPKIYRNLRHGPFEGRNNK